MKVRIYECPGERHELTAREACLTRIVEDLASVGGERLVIERTTPQSATTSGPCTRLSGSSASPGSLQYVHLRAKEETLLALPDAFAWCYAKGGEWRRRTQALLDEHVRL